jgi:ABC-2 type transport system permease protein
MYTDSPLQRTVSVARKESLHIVRDPATLFFALFIPVLELFMLGYAIDTNIRYVRTAVLDQAGTQESRQLLQVFDTSQTFRITLRVNTDEELYRAIVAGKARVGIKIPQNYSTRLEGGQTAQIRVLVDGSESSVAGETLNVSNAIALRESLKRALGDKPLPVDSSPDILFNPSTRSPNFFLPGLMVVMVLTLVEFVTILTLMWLVFDVPIHGHVLTLLLLTLPFTFCFLGLGLLISTRVSTREAAGQMALGTMMPSIFLSGYVFPLDSMPWPFWYLAQMFPTTWLIDAARGVILRGAGWAELWVHAVVLWGMGVGVFVLSMLKFRKQLT